MPRRPWTRAPLRRMGRIPFVLLALVGAVLVLGGCGSIAQPQGWAAPVVTPSGVITSLHKGKLALSDPTGKTIVWQFPPATDKKTNLKGVYGTPAVTDSTVIFGAYNGHVYALKLTDGSRIWDTNTGASIVGSVALSGDTAFVGNSDGQVQALNLANGARRWSYQTGERVWSSPVIQNNAVFVTSMDRKVYAFDLNGARLWTATSAGGAIASTPSLDSGRLYFGSFDRHVYALDASSGKEIWQSQPPSDNWIWAYSLVSGSTLYTGGLSGNIYAVDTGDGHVLWSKKMSDSIRGRPALAQGVLVVADRKGELQGFDPSSGASMWNAPVELQSTTLGDLVVSNDKVLVVTEGGTGGSRLLQIDPKTGDTTVLTAA